MYEWMVMTQIGTAFIHLLSPALDELGGDAPCLSPAWQEYVSCLSLHPNKQREPTNLISIYRSFLPSFPFVTKTKPYALALALLSIFSIFIVELMAFRIGTAKLQKLGIHHGM